MGRKRSYRKRRDDDQDFVWGIDDDDDDDSWFDDDKPFGKRRGRSNSKRKRSGDDWFGWLDDDDSDADIGWSSSARQALLNLGQGIFDFFRMFQTQQNPPAEEDGIAITEEEINAVRSLVDPVEGKALDLQQISCIAKDARSHLVLAGAGTGKTTTMIGYVKYLLKAGKCSPGEILVLSFTNASAGEAKARLQSETGYDIEASTFHSLGSRIITASTGKKQRIYAKDIRHFVRKQLDDLISDERYLNKLLAYLTFFGTSQKSAFDFDSPEEYQDYLKHDPPITMKKEKVKSYGEMDIANFLYQNGIAYVYEPDYPVDTRSPEYGQYKPDFFLPDLNLYIEYFGIDRNGNVPPWFSQRNGKSASQTYRESMEWKRSLHKTNGTRMIEVYAYEKLEGKLLDSLKARLQNAGAVLNPKSAQELWKEISGGRQSALDRVAELFGTVISLIKSNDMGIAGIRERNANCGALFGIELALDLIDPIFERYEQMLRDNDALDFNDLISASTKYVVTGRYKHPYKYVVIDEYQDISQDRYRLLSEMRKQSDYSLFCVGDDWQSIYRFSGSDIGFILQFSKYWGDAVTSKIETTYRFPRDLIEISSDFIMRNPAQHRKHLISAVPDIGFPMEMIEGYTETYAVKFMEERLNSLPKGAEVLFLGRYRFDIRILDQNKLFSYQYSVPIGKTVVKYSKRPDLNISFLTVHSSKGLQADYVFILNNKKYGMGFPSQIADAPILSLLLDNCDLYPHAEERRLFYVAITRARKKVFLLAINGNRSIFVEELMEDYEDDMRKARYTCPQCGGRLIRHQGPYGEFYGCSNYRTEGCRYKRPIPPKPTTASMCSY